MVNLIYKETLGLFSVKISRFRILNIVKANRVSYLLLIDFTVDERKKKM